MSLVDAMPTNGRRWLRGQGASSLRSGSGRGDLHGHGFTAARFCAATGRAQAIGSSRWPLPWPTNGRRWRSGVKGHRPCAPALSGAIFTGTASPLPGSALLQLQLQLQLQLRLRPLPWPTNGRRWRSGVKGHRPCAPALAGAIFSTFHE